MTCSTDAKPSQSEQALRNAIDKSIRAGEVCLAQMRNAGWTLPDKTNAQRRRRECFNDLWQQLADLRSLKESLQ